MMTKIRPPILPRNRLDPTGADRLERGAMRAFRVRMRRAYQAYKSTLDRIPVEPAVNRKYTFRLDKILLAGLLADVDSLIDSIFLEGGERDLWFFDAYVSVAYARGTAQEFANIGQQSRAYKAGQQDLANIMRSEPYRRRMALIRTREFEEMKGLSGSVKANMSRILTDGIGRGLNPRDIAKSLRDQAGVEERRANRIARTEITTALRRARWDESEEGARAYGLRGKQMHISALSPTTRPSHAARHGNLYETDEVQDWYAKDGNSINCKCGQVFVLVDENDKPLVPDIQKRARETYEKLAADESRKWARKKHG